MSLRKRPIDPHAFRDAVDCIREAHLSARRADYRRRLQERLATETAPLDRLRAACALAEESRA